MPALTILDDHLSNPSYVWTELSGPGDILFTDKFAADTSIGANQGGDYQLQLTVIDDAGNSADRSFFFYWDDEPPSVEAGSHIITNTSVALSGITSDGPTSLSGIAHEEWSIDDIPSSGTANIGITDKFDLIQPSRPTRAESIPSDSQLQTMWDRQPLIPWSTATIPKHR
jgi:hypothetical protein